MANSLFSTRLRRAAAYAVLGVAGEVVFTALDGLTRRSTRNAKLEGHSFIWMLPIYGSAAWLFEPVHDRMRSLPAWQRAATYTAGIFGVEFATGMMIKKLTGIIPWDYSEQSRFSVAGAIRLDYTPVWASVGLAAERVHDQLVNPQ